MIAARSARGALSGGCRSRVQLIKIPGREPHVPPGTAVVGGAERCRVRAQPRGHHDMQTKLKTSDATASADRIWEQEIVPALVDYIRIPNKSPHFDPKWHEHGHMDRAVALIERWCR